MKNRFNNDIIIKTFRGVNLKKVLITGGATGIGKATALLFKQKGYDVFITYNQSEPDFDGITKIKCNLENGNEIIELLIKLEA